MAYCKVCGSTIEEFDRVCANCGTPVAGNTSSLTEPAVSAHRPASRDVQTAPVVGSWSFVGSILLLGLPVVGLILAIVWAAGAVSNRNLRNLARANLLLILIWTVLLLSVLLSILVKFGSMLTFANYLVGLFG